MTKKLPDTSGWYKRIYQTLKKAMKYKGYPEQERTVESSAVQI